MSPTAAESRGGSGGGGIGGPGGGDAPPSEDEAVLLEGAAEALRRAQRALLVGPRQDHHELLPAVARGLVALAEGLAEEAGQRAQRGVSGGGARGVVALLEGVAGG